jgi:hypothetical protein
MNDGKLTIDLSGVGNDIPTKLGKSRPTLTSNTDIGSMRIIPRTDPFGGVNYDLGHP